jgi:opacity protein-like surface antigen
MLVRYLGLPLSLFLSFSFSTSLYARTCYPVTLTLSPYAGIDIQSRHIGYETGYGSNLFPKSFPQANLYAGLMLTEMFGFEFGYERTQQKSRTSHLVTGDNSLGFIIPEDTSIVYHSKAKISGPHFNILSAWCVTPEYPLEIFGSLGAALLTAKFSRSSVSIDGVPTVSQRTFDHNKVVARISLGTQYALLDNLYLRGTLTWENTSKFKLFAREPVFSGPIPQIKLKDSFSYGIGAFYAF